MRYKSIILLLTLSAIANGQSFKREIQLLDSSGKVKAYRTSIVLDGVETVLSKKGKVTTDREKLKPGEWLYVHEYGEYRGSEPKITEPDYLTVSAEGFTPDEISAIKRAINSWNVGKIRFIYDDDGQVRIKRQKLTVMALSIVQIQGEKAVSAEIGIDPHVTNLDALQSVLAHELGHVLGLPDCSSCDSIMRSKSKGRNKTNGFVGPTNLDLANLRE